MTPPTAAGWYPDPDGIGVQRYWDGDSWTEHRAPADSVAPAEPPADEQPTAVVKLRSVPTVEHVGAHRAPDSDSEPEPTPAAEPVTTPANDNRSVLLKYGAACAALLVVLVGLTIYAFLIERPPEVQLSTPADRNTTTVPRDTAPTGGWGAGATPETLTAAPTTEAPVGPAGEATDGPLSFAVHGLDIGPTVVMSDAPIEKIAEGEFIVVHMTVTNVGTEAESFVGMFQTLRAGGTTYPLADEATAYLGGTAAELAPGASADVSLAFDVPPGTVPEAIELHAEPGTPGVQVPLP